ncbi:MAG: hypothetical protein AB8H79_18590 [Myxococcota bacterium]
MNARVFVVACLLLGASACADPKDSPSPIEKSAYRISKPDVRDTSELTVDILYDRRRCRNVFTRPDDFDENYFSNHDERINSCVPKVDRATGQVQLSFRLAQRDNPNKLLMLPLEQKHIRVAHAGRQVPMFDLESYNPTRAGQLFLLLIDHSGSMRIEDGEGVSRMQRVKNALWLNRKTFINSDAAVALFRFTTSLQGLNGSSYKDVVPMRSTKAFKAELEQLGGGAGFTHMYKAVDRAVGDLIDKDTAVARFLGQNDMQPTIVLLTDGFNNTRGDELCKDNASQLSRALATVKNARRKPPSKRPEVYTVGFGVGFRPGFTPPEDEIKVRTKALCGKFENNRIDGDLDKARIDNVSLQWLAAVGGGRAFIKRDYRELERVFAETAPERFVWYKAKYQADPILYHRTNVVSKISITGMANASSSVMLYPSAWFDAPSGKLPEGESVWVEPGDIRRATAFAVPALAGLIFLTFLGPALFNTRRALFRRGKKTNKKK